MDSRIDPRIDPRFLTPGPRVSREEQQVRAVAKEFEAVMVGQMFKAMRSSSSPGLLDGGSAMRTYREMLDDEMSREMARGRGLGLADALVRELLKSPTPHPPAGSASVDPPG